MRDDEIDAMRADLQAPPAAKAETEAPSPADVENAPPAALQADPELMQAAIVPLVRIVGEVLTARAKVSPLDDGEVRHLALALTNVAAQYQFAMSPRAAAWLGLGFVSSAIIEKRSDEWRSRKTIPTSTAPASISTPLEPVLPAGVDPLPQRGL